MTHKAYLYKKKKNYDKGLEIVDELWEKNPKDLEFDHVLLLKYKKALKELKE